MMIKIGLTSKRNINGIDEYIFPSNVYEVTGFYDFSDSDVLTEYAVSKLSKYKDLEIQLYINGGLTIEIVSTLIAAESLNISVICLHLDRDKDTYREQTTRWKKYNITQDLSVTYSLCANRHPGMPPALIQKIEPELFFDFEWQEQKVREKLTAENATGKELLIYITGLTVLLLSTLNVAADLHMPVTCMHYDLAKEQYIPQKMHD